MEIRLGNVICDSESRPISLLIGTWGTEVTMGLPCYQLEFLDSPRCGVSGGAIYYVVVGLNELMIC